MRCFDAVNLAHWAFSIQTSPQDETFLTLNLGLIYKQVANLLKIRGTSCKLAPVVEFFSCFLRQYLASVVGEGTSYKLAPEEGELAPEEGELAPEAGNLKPETKRGEVRNFTPSIFN